MIYLNNAATSYPKPKSVVNAVTDYLNDFPFQGSRSSNNEKEDIVQDTREKFCKLFNCSNPSQIVFTSGSTEALNLIFFGLNLEKSHAIITETEHNAVIRPLKFLESKNVISLSIAECDEYGFVDPKNIEKLIQENTRLIAVNHCSNVTGTVQDIKKISDIAHKNDALVISDSSQAAGEIPIDVEDSGVDVLVFTGHKSLFGMPGIGGMYIKEGVEPVPLKHGGSGSKSELLYQPKEMPGYYEAGTPNIPGIISLRAGLDFIFSTGFNEIKMKKQKYFKSIWKTMKELPNITLYGHDDLENRSAVVSFNVDGFEPSDIAYILENKYDMIIRDGLHCAPLIHKKIGTFPFGTVRVSPSYFSTDEEVNTFIKAVTEISSAALQ